MERLVTASELAEVLNLHPKTVYEMTRKGRIPHFKIGSAVRYRTSDIETWLRSSSCSIVRSASARTLTTD